MAYWPWNFLATDASVALMQTAKSRLMTDSYWYFFGGGASLYFVWSGNNNGAFLSSGIPDPELVGLDFAIIAIFAILLACGAGMLTYFRGS